MATPSRWSSHPRGQQIIPLCDSLISLGLSPLYEVGFEWLSLPSQREGTQNEIRIKDSLIAHAIATVGAINDDETPDIQRRGRRRKADQDPSQVLEGLMPRLHLDIWIQSLQLAIEFDENQHFSEERGVSLGCYPNLTFPFDLVRWKRLCSQNTYDPDPPGRDWQRAYRDSIRDLQCQVNGIPLLRIHHRDVVDPKTVLALIQAAKPGSLGGLDPMH